MKKFVLDFKTYEYYEVSEILNNPRLLPWADTYTGTQYINIGCGFDIETSKITNDFSTMYMWQMSLEKITIIGRQWYEFLELLDVLQKHFDLTEKRKLLCFVHNLSYEWQFIHKHLQFAIDKKHDNLPKIFAMEERKIVYFETIQHIEFRDSLILTQRPLEKLSSAYNLDTKKLVGNVDYTQIVSHETFLDNKTIAYAINDVQILSEFFRKYVCTQFFRKKKKLPLTATGIVRADIKESFRKQPKEEKERYKKMLVRSYPKEKEYKDLFRWVFRGGFVHSNITTTDIIIENENIGSQDFKSSYPAVLLHNKFPRQFCRKKPDFFYKIMNDRKWINEHAFYGVFEFTNIKASSPHSIESISKLINYDNKSLLVDNGRLVKCDRIVVALTEVDWLIYQDFYTWDSVKCLRDLRVSVKHELPSWIKDVILKYFSIKESQPKDSLDYKLGKSQLNSIYGCMVTSIFNGKLAYIDNKLIPIEQDKTYDELKRNEILLPFYGIWCTAYARYNLLHYGFKKFADANSDLQAFYGDTDSIKYKNIIGNQYIFDDFNNRINRLNKQMYVGEYDRNLFMNIGKFDFEGKWWKCKFLGAKRYIYNMADYDEKETVYRINTHVTIAGCRKGSLQEYCRNNNLDIYKTFTNGLQLTEKDSNKLTTKYKDDAMQMTFTDIDGNVVTHEELSNVSLVPIPFTMTLSNDYLGLLMSLKEKNKLTVSERTY